MKSEEIVILNPEVKVLLHKNGLILERETAVLCRDGWYPIGGVGKRGNDWVQVLMKEREVESGRPKSITESPEPTTE